VLLRCCCWLRRYELREPSRQLLLASRNQRHSMWHVACGMWHVASVAHHQAYMY
jgi:hypothetical protein